ncbi:NAD(P)/FAD-dependent oxidoreductase [Sulfitobacter sp.]|uniref:NAD(P)/FAD-dependent oxidoreductase n=1 Tax=Sulfitobacter sp. TaxID=1903071 RepID=UPI003001517D
MSQHYDIAVIGGGIMGCGAALRVAEGGMRPILLDLGDLGQGASGVNAGTLSLQIKRVKLIPYALRGHKMWEEMGDAIGFRKTGGFTVAFNNREAELLQERQTLKAAAGAPIEFVSVETLRKAEPTLSQKVKSGKLLRRGQLCQRLADGSILPRKAARCGHPLP